MKRPKYIIKQLAEVNDYLRQMKVQDHHNNLLFHWWCNYLSSHGWYSGWNFHIDREIDINGEKKIVRALTGVPEELSLEDKANYYIQIW